MAGVNIKAKARQAGSVTIIDVSGRLTLATDGTVLRDTLATLISKGQRKLLLNLRDLSFMDSSGIGQLVRAYVTVRRQAGDLKLLHVTKEVYNLLQTAGLHMLFEIHTDEQTAIRSFG